MKKQVSKSSKSVKTTKTKQVVKPIKKTLASSQKKAKNDGQKLGACVLGGNSIIAKERAKLGLNQTEFASKVGLSRSTIAILERGESTVKFERASTIASFLGLSVDTLFVRPKNKVGYLARQ